MIDFAQFIACHEPALEQNQARHMMILGLFNRMSDKPDTGLRWWSLGSPGQCAIQTGSRPFILGEVDKPAAECLAELTIDDSYKGVMGPDATATWFAAHAARRGLRFGTSIPQRILQLTAPPRLPGAPGSARKVGSGDADLFADWITAFIREASPHDPIAPRDQLKERAARGEHWLWIVDEEPVALAGIVRRTRNGAAVAAVYTSPPHRGRGYAGSITATVAQKIFEEGRRLVFLYTNAMDPASNRCYAKIGFEPVCSSWLYLTERPLQATVPN